MSLSLSQFSRKSQTRESHDQQWSVWGLTSTFCLNVVEHISFSHQVLHRICMQLLLKAEPWSLKQIYVSKVAIFLTVCNYNCSYLSYLTSSVEVYSCWPVFILHVQNCLVFLPCTKNKRSLPQRYNSTTMVRFEIISVSVTNRVYFLIFPFISRPVSSSHTLYFSSFYSALSWHTPCIQHILLAIFINSTHQSFYYIHRASKSLDPLLPSQLPLFLWHTFNKIYVYINI